MNNYNLPYTGAQVQQAIENTNTNATNLQNHIDNISNPHGVTAAQVGLGNVDNTSDLDKPISTATQQAINSVETLANQAKSIAEGRSQAKVFATLDAMNTWLSDPTNTSTLNIGDNLYIEDTNVPDYWWTGTEAQVLETSSVDLTDYYTKEQLDSLLQAKYTFPSGGIPLTDLSSSVQASLGKADTALQSVPSATTAIQGIALLGATGGAARYGYPGDVGLSNVNNTSDADKPISTATQAALNAIDEQIATLSGQISTINNLLNQDGYRVLFVKDAAT